MAANRMNKDEFFRKMAPVDEAGLRKALWTAYWRGTDKTRELIEESLSPTGTRVRKAPAKPDPTAVAAEVAEFVTLANEGAYMGRDRRVSRQERSKWRHTFRRLAKETTDALAGDHPDPAIGAMESLIDLACQTKRYQIFHTEDAMEAARFIVSDAAEALWVAIRRQHGFAAFSTHAARGLWRWESRFGWTLHGWGWVPERETSLAQVVARMLTSADAWGQLAEDYLRVLDDPPRPAFEPESLRAARNERTSDLAEWHRLLIEQLMGTDYEDRLDRLVIHPALSGPELTFLQAQLAAWHGNQEEARVLIQKCRRALPGHSQFKALAEEVGA